MNSVDYGNEQLTLDFLKEVLGVAKELYDIDSEGYILDGTRRVTLNELCEQVVVQGI